MTIAHYLTLFRLLISPLFLLFYLEYEQLRISATMLPYILLLLLAFSELSDAFDGFLARRYNQVTDLGKLIDPMADSICRLSVFLTLTEYPVKLPIPFVFLFFYRDSMIGTLRTLCALNGVTLAARASGKIKAIIQALAAFIVVLLMIPHSTGALSTGALHEISTGVVAIAVIYTLYSAVDYFFANWRHLTKFLVFRPSEP